MRGNLTMTMRIATAAWADPDEVEERYPYRDGTVWLGRSGSDGRLPLGYLDDRHVCLVGGSRGGKGTTSIIPALITWRAVTRRLLLGGSGRTKPE